METESVDEKMVLQAKIEEEKNKELLREIATLDSSVVYKTIEEETASFDNMPSVFLGLATKTFGNSINNPFFELMEKVMNKDTSFEDRTQGLRYMQRIPHIKREKNCIKCALEILNDDRYPIFDRFKFFANNDKFVKLDYDIVNACHKYFFENFDQKFKTPLEYKILSSQYLLTQYSLTLKDIEDIQSFLISIAKDKNVPINYRAECADVLSRAGYNNAKDIGNEVIEELGSLYSINKRNTIYSNLQNVHDTTITKQLLECLSSLIQTIVPTKHAGEIYEILVELTKRDERSETIIKSFQRILIDTARYENITMCDIMCLVWEKIHTSDNRIELEKRFIDELFEMYDTCSSGHLSRLLNILSGFFEDITPLKISYDQQLRSNIFAHYTLSLKSLSLDIQNDITEEMTSEYKPTILEFIFSYSPEKDLFEEFKEFINKEDYDKIYKKAECDFFGIEYISPSNRNIDLENKEQ